MPYEIGTVLTVPIVLRRLRCARKPALGQHVLDVTPGWSGRPRAAPKTTWPPLGRMGACAQRSVGPARLTTAPPALFPGPRAADDDAFGRLKSAFDWWSSSAHLTSPSQPALLIASSTFWSSTVTRRTRRGVRTPIRTLGERFCESRQGQCSEPIYTRRRGHHCLPLPFPY